MALVQMLMPPQVPGEGHRNTESRPESRFTALLRHSHAARVAALAEKRRLVI